MALLAAASSVSSLANGFAVDDLLIIAGNPRVHSLRESLRAFASPYWPPDVGAGFYRPFAIVGYAVEWKLGGGAPWLFHAVNVVLYMACAVAVWWLASHVVGARAAWVVGALFAVHPTHVEAVGNVIGQAELVVGIACVLAVVVYLRARRRGELSARAIAAISALYLVASFTKEHGLVLPGLLAITEVIAVRDRRPLGERARSLAVLGGAMLAIAIAYLALRSAIPGVRAGETSQALLAGRPPQARLYSFLGVVPDYLRLLYWPAHLSVDYAPGIVAVLLGWSPRAVAGLLLLALALGVGVAAARRAPAVTFGLAWLAVTLALPSGVFVAVGTLIAERFLFLPSVGAMLVVGGAIDWATDALRVPSRARYARPAARAAAVAIILVVVAGAWKSARRQRVWRDSASWKRQLLRDAPRSAHAIWLVADSLIAAGRTDEGLRSLDSAVRLMYRPDGFVHLAEQYRRAARCERAVRAYRQADTMEPLPPAARAGLAECLAAVGDYEAARAEADRVLATRPESGIASRAAAARRVADSALAGARAGRH